MPRPRGRKQQVALRVKVRDRRKKGLGRLLLVAALAAGIYGALRAADVPGRARRALGPALVVRSVDASGVPQPLS